MKNRIVKVSSTIIVSVLVITGFIISYNKTNKNMPGYTYHYFKTYDTVNCDDIKMTISDVKKYLDDQYCSIYNLEKSED